ncbi:HAD-IIB family hydrolase [Metamycoplasma hominis]|uniref:HAD-IIB family hydrolase n=1 Tax=Metamycoplasma hominis TaxID=2098 RepID=UPI00066AD7C3|nr:HAD-IIB family hydrolase [Metamycoplasma hominis]
MINFKPKAYFLDMDGTYLDLPRKKQIMISEKNVEVAKDFNNRGIPVILSTGRGNSKFVLDLTNKINAPFAVCQNGGVIVDKNNNVLKRHEINPDTLKSIIEILIAQKMFFIFNSGDTIYGTKTKFRIARAWLKKLNKVTYDEIQSLPATTKILTFGKSKKGIIKLRDELLNAFHDISTHIVSKGYSIEISDINANKGIGDRFVCDLLNIDYKEAVHLGDSGNDVVTQKYLGGFVAMKNSTKNVKQKADYVGYSYKKSGVAKTLQELQK